VADTTRLEDLRRRVQKDPASLAFAQLAEEYRRAGEYDEAIRTCCDGLTHHPTYVSARVTLGRALLAVGDIDAAEHELRAALEAAPQNLAALRTLAEIHQLRGNTADALADYRAAQALAPDDLDLARAIAAVEDVLGGKSDDAARGTQTDAASSIRSQYPEPGTLNPEPHTDAATRSAPLEIARGTHAAEPTAEGASSTPISALEGWLAAIQRDRASRTNRA
jgi:tetratricopeptide (TPR) repeat protein